MAARKNHRGCKSCGNLRSVKKINELSDCSHPAAVYNRKNRIHRVRTRSKKLNIPKLVYKFLGNVASLESEENDEKRPTRSRSRTIKSKKQQYHSDAVHVATKSVDESSTSVSTSRTMGTNSTICTLPSTPTSFAKSGMKAEQKFSIQAIKDYIKAGIAEGKRRAKKYMCKALSFGVDTGYLIPTDSDVQVLRVSSALGSFTEAQNDEVKNGERGIRQKLRKGDTTCTSQERKLLRRRETPLPKKRPRSQSSVPSSSTSSTKRTTRPKTKKPKYGKRIKKHKPRTSKKVKLKRGSGRPKGWINSAKLKGEKSSPGVCKPENHDRKEKENCREETLTSSRSAEDNANSIKKENPSYPSIEENRSLEEIKEK